MELTETFFSFLLGCDRTREEEMQASDVFDMLVACTKFFLSIFLSHFQVFVLDRLTLYYCYASLIFFFCLSGFFFSSGACDNI
jgi:hypothetical protein